MEDFQYAKQTKSQKSTSSNYVSYNTIIAKVYTYHFDRLLTYEIGSGYL